MPTVPTTTGTVSAAPVDGIPLNPDISLDFNGYGVGYNEWQFGEHYAGPRDGIVDKDGVLTVVNSAGVSMGVTVVAGGMTGALLGESDITFNDKHGNPGLGLHSPSDPSIGFWYDSTGSEIGQGEYGNPGEFFQFFLPEGQIAYGLMLNLTHFYANDVEIERCEIVFYRAGAEVHSLIVTADSDDGKANTGSYLSAAYDSVLIRPIAMEDSTWTESSDFNIESIRFIGFSDGEYILASASGKVQANFGADGPATTPYDVTVTGGQIDGANILWQIDGTNPERFVGTDPVTGDVVADVFFKILNQGSTTDTPTLTWSFYQYAGFDTGASGISINHAAIDSDGDKTLGKVQVEVLDTMAAQATQPVFSPFAHTDLDEGILGAFALVQTSDIDADTDVLSASNSAANDDFGNKTDIPLEEAEPATELLENSITSDEEDALPGSYADDALTWYDDPGYQGNAAPDLDGIRVAWNQSHFVPIDDVAAIDALQNICFDEVQAENQLAFEGLLDGLGNTSDSAGLGENDAFSMTGMDITCSLGTPWSQTELLTASGKNHEEAMQADTLVACNDPDLAAANVGVELLALARQNMIYADFGG